jgi:hypothetical protein
MNTQSRYNSFISDGRCEYVPFIPIIKQSTDYYIIFDKNSMRMDKLSYQYYKNPNYGWLIMQANPELGSLEFLIENGSVLRIPYPLENALKKYEDDILKYKNIYGTTK